MAFATATSYGMRSCKRGVIGMPSPYRLLDCMAQGGCSTGATHYDAIRAMRGGVPDVMHTANAFGQGCKQGPIAGEMRIFIGANSIKREILKNGPLTWSLMGTNGLSDYTGGVYTPPTEDDAKATEWVVIGHQVL